jgi:hypothetical protein
MNSIAKLSAVSGVILGVSVICADIVVEDFANWVGVNKGGGLWLADSDVYGGGSSTVTDPLGGEDVVQNSANILLTYDSDNQQIISNVKVSADVPGKNWAYAGWVMDFRPIDTVGVTEPWNLPQWERKNEVNLSGCDALQMTLQFTANRQLWIELYNPFQEKDFPLAPQYGWRFYEASGGMVTRTFKLSGLGGPVTKWTDPANTKPKDFTKVNRIKILYEGQEGAAVVSPSPYDSAQHQLIFKSVRLTGGANCVVPGYSGTDGIIARRAAKSGYTFSSAAGRLTFGNLAKIGELRVQIRNLQGKILTQGVVNGLNSSLDVSSLKNGVYAMQVAGRNVQESFPITVLK